MGYPTELFIDQDISDGFKCSICHDIQKDPVSMNSGDHHTYCRDCAEEWRQKSKICPLGEKRVTTLKNAPPSFIRVLHDLKMRCPFSAAGCTAIFKLGDFSDHDERCRINPENQKECAGGCGAILNQAQIKAKSHNCIAYLKEQLTAKDKLVQEKDVELGVRLEEAARYQEQIRKLEHNGKRQKSSLVSELKAKEAALDSAVKDLGKCQEQIRKLEQTSQEQKLRLDAELKAKETTLKERDALLQAKDAELNNFRDRINDMEHYMSIFKWDDEDTHAAPKENQIHVLAQTPPTYEAHKAGNSSTSSAAAVASSSHGHLKRKLDIMEPKTIVFKSTTDSSPNIIFKLEWTLPFVKTLSTENLQTIIDVMGTELQQWSLPENRQRSCLDVGRNIAGILNGSKSPLTTTRLDWTVQIRLSAEDLCLFFSNGVTPRLILRVGSMSNMVLIIELE